MKSITEEQRQALIERFRNIKITGKANRLEISEIAEIALASLTVDESKLSLLANNLLSAIAENVEFGGLWEEIENAERKLIEEAIKHTAPPVPVIKLPDEILPMGQDSEYDSGHEEGWNDCLAEVNRLNGWKAND